MTFLSKHIYGSNNSKTIFNLGVMEGTYKALLMKRPIFTELDAPPSLIRKEENVR